MIELFLIKAIGYVGLKESSFSEEGVNIDQLKGELSADCRPSEDSVLCYGRPS